MLFRSFFFSGFAQWYIASAAPGRPNIIKGNLPAMKRVALTENTEMCIRDRALAKRCTLRGLPKAPPSGELANECEPERARLLSEKKSLSCKKMCIRDSHHLPPRAGISELRPEERGRGEPFG